LLDIDDQIEILDKVLEKLYKKEILENLVFVGS